MKSIFFIILILFTQAIFATGLKSTLIPSNSPKEIYGPKDAEIKIKISNGGAGPTGILRALSEDYLKLTRKKIAIAWYQNTSFHSLSTLKNGETDIALIYEPEKAKQAVQENYASHLSLIFYDHLLITGPKNNPASLLAIHSVSDAFKKIYVAGENSKEKNRGIFLSRDDQSGTNLKEHHYWSEIGIAPWKTLPAWYIRYRVFPHYALIKADQENLYTLTDRATWLSSSNDLTNSKIYIQNKKALRFPCFALLGKHPNELILDFLNYLKSPRAQKIITEFGKERFGTPIFTNAAQPDF